MVLAVTGCAGTPASTGARRVPVATPDPDPVARDRAETAGPVPAEGESVEDAQEVAGEPMVEAGPPADELLPETRDDGTGDDAVVVHLANLEGCPQAPSPSVPRVRVSEPRVGEPHSIALVRRVVRRAWAELGECYRDSDAHRECRAAETKVALALEPDGSVGPVSSEGELAGSCVERVLGALRFPEPRGGGRVLLRFGLRVGP